MPTDYSKLPEHCRGGMKRYIEEGIPPGDFLEAVICNDLVQAFARADDTNITRLFDYANFLYNEVPSVCWGSKEKMLGWTNGFRITNEPKDLPEGEE